MGVLNLESVLQEQRPRLTKCKDSGNDSVTFAATKKCAYIGAENVHE